MADLLAAFLGHVVGLIPKRGLGRLLAIVLLAATVALALAAAVVAVT